LRCLCCTWWCSSPRRFQLTPARRGCSSTRGGYRQSPNAQKPARRCSRSWRMIPITRARGTSSSRCSREEVRSRDGAVANQKSICSFASRAATQGRCREGGGKGVVLSTILLYWIYSCWYRASPFRAANLAAQSMCVETNQAIGIKPCMDVKHTRPSFLQCALQRTFEPDVLLVGAFSAALL